MQSLVLAALLIGLAGARIATLLVHDTILDAPRDWLYRHFPPFDNPMTGHDYQQRDVNGRKLPEGAPLRDGSMLGELFTCTRCTSVWTTALVGVAWYFAGDEVRYALAVVAAMWLGAYGAKKL